MAETRETPEMIELENMREEHAKKLAGLSPDEKLRLYKQEAEQARKNLGLNLPQADKASTSH